jgi:hypothetical protein
LALDEKDLASSLVLFGQKRRDTRKVHTASTSQAEQLGQPGSFIHGLISNEMRIPPQFR